MIISNNVVVGLGWVSQMKNGSLWCHFDDGTQLVVHSENSDLQYVDKSGTSLRYVRMINVISWF